MWRTALPLLVGVLGVGAVASRKRDAVAPGLIAKTFTSGARFKPLRMSVKPEIRFKGVQLPPRRVGLKEAARFAVREDPLVVLFGVPTEGEYPAPYRYRDAWELANIVLAAGSQTAPKFKPYYKTLRARLQQIDRAALPNWRKTYAVIMTVVLPSYASPLWWHWYRPTSRVKEDRFNAIITWAALFLTMPQTATAARDIQPDRGMSSLLPSFGAYLDPNAALRRGDLDPRDMRRCIYDVYSYSRNWPFHHRGEFGWGESLQETMLHAGQRMADLNAVYPLSDPTKFVIQGNLKAVDELVWLANARVQGSIAVDFDETKAIVALVLNVVKVLASAVDVFVGGAIGNAIRQATDAIGAIATMAADGSINPAQLQAMAGAGVAMVLDQAGIRLGYDEQIRALHGAVQG